VSAQLTLSPPFPLPGAASPLFDIAMLPHRATIPSHKAKTSSLPPLHLLATLHPVTSPLELELKHWIHTIATGHPPWTVRLPPSNPIKRSSQPWLLSPPLNHVSIFPPSQSTMPSGAPPATVVSFHHYPTHIVHLHNDTHSDELVDSLSLLEQLISMWIHIKRYFKISQHHMGLSTSIS
jgi:hypothetical protein